LEPKCPYCGAPADAEFVDVEVGFQQVTPWTCTKCDAVMIHSVDIGRELTLREKQTGWLEPPYELYE
jgi:hypothetical protein